MDVDLLPFSDKTAESQERHLKLLEHLEQQKRARQIAVPTNDEIVKSRLRELGEPICLFGEQAADRRNRLREVMAKRNILDPSSSSSATVPVAAISSNKSKRDPKDEQFYTEGSQELKQARLAIAHYSLPRARDRIAQAKKLQEDQEKELERADRAETLNISHTRDKHLVDLHTHLRQYTAASSQIGDDRPLSSCSFSPSGSRLVTGSWTGVCSTWDTNTCLPIAKFVGHEERVSDVKYHPNTSSALSFASCGADRTIQFWREDSPSAPVATLTGHRDRINRIAFHPSGNYLASTSFDLTWRLWDIETKKELLQQEGHTRPAFAIAFQGDGALCATAGLDAIGRIWDLRIGRFVYVMKGHVKQILAMDFAPNGFQVATGSEDHTVRIWDIRKKRSVYTIPAHFHLVSGVKYQPGSGEFLVTASYDRTCKMWATKDWSPLNTLAAHEGKVMDLDITADSGMIASVSYDRTWKLWSPNSNP
eukprot:TRINITY_DN3720_c0_g1_i1.p1 TRINITY_DN3720_c0_g1~~TRINITY_DN3720_c0_g1_i1.p1  ORF type:complete len:527 (-),score=98.66 TRINITY_DN3720_c0_g1_i1:96-1532(-)